MLPQIKYVSVIAFSVFVFYGCKHHPEIKPFDNSNGGTDTTSTSKKCDPDSVYFVNEILPLIVSKCASEVGCHSAADFKGEVQLDNYKNIIKTGEIDSGNSSESKLYKMIISTSEPMPPLGSLSGALTQDQKDLIKKWINQGAKNNYCSSACDTSSYTYSGAIENILKNNNCRSCHLTSGPALAPALATYSDVKILADSGRLSGAVNHELGFEPMPSINSSISDCEKKQIAKWIADGAQNN
jgi:uncharacterized membrane protein